MPVRPDLTLTLLPTTAIAAAVTAQATTPIVLPGGVRALCLQANFAYGADGTTVKAWVQTSLDGGTTWIDIANFAFTTAAARKISTVHLATALTGGTTPSTAALADNTILNGVIGDRLRVVLTTTGTYSGATSLSLTGIGKV